MNTKEKQWKCVCNKEAEEFSLCDNCEVKNKLTAFLEEEKESLYDLHCINGAMYFGAVENPCSGRETGECCQHEQTYEEADNELSKWLKDHDTRLINFVLDIVGEEIEELKTPPYPVENEKLSMLQEGAHIGYNDAKYDIKQILTKIKSSF